VLLSHGRLYHSITPLQHIPHLATVAHIRTNIIVAQFTVDMVWDFGLKRN
jgi:hypothetical protein